MVAISAYLVKNINAWLKNSSAIRYCRHMEKSTRPHLPIAYSPCPNDTFLFHAWATGLVGQEYPISPVLADVQHLNEWAQQKKYPVSKVSMHCLGHILNDYVLLPSGCALGYSCGPKIIASKAFDIRNIASKRIAIPGRDTTAHLLFNVLLDPATEKHFCTYDQVLRMIRSGLVDCGLIIHETRFTFQDSGFVEIADLGDLWESRYHLPLPLGGIVAKRSLGQETLNDISAIIQASLKLAYQDPQCSRDYVFMHSIEKEPEVIRKHIELYVNQDTLGLTEKGRAAIDKLLQLAREHDLIPPNTNNWLFEVEQPYEIH